MEAGAKEKIQIEVAGSFDEYGKLDMNKLKENLKNNLGLIDEDINEYENKKLNVKIGEYEFLICYDGDILRVVTTPPTSTVNDKTVYRDVNSGNKEAIIPEGFRISETLNEQKIDTGLVVIGPDKSEFVWVPVNDINDMTQCSNADGTCDIELQLDETLKCKTHNSSNIVGKLYAITTGENFLDNPNVTYIQNSGLREPDIVVTYDNNQTYNQGLLNLQSLQKEYNDMALSVAKNGGFYISRYEMCLSDATQNSAGDGGTACSKKGVIPTSAGNSATSTWYGLYEKAKTYTIEENSVISSMIWGSQYDAMLNWVKSGTDATKVTTVDIGGNYSGTVTTTGNNLYSNDSLNNIRDLGGNLFEWTLEAYQNHGRVTRVR